MDHAKWLHGGRHSVEELLRADIEVHAIRGKQGAVTILATLMPLQHDKSNQRAVFPGTLFPMLANTLCLGKSVRTRDVLNIYPNAYINISLNVYMLSESASEYFSDLSALSLGPFLSQSSCCCAACLLWLYVEWKHWVIVPNIIRQEAKLKLL